MKSLIKYLLILGIFISINSNFSAMAQVLGPSQLVNLYGSSNSYAVNSFSLIAANGTTQSFQIPSGKTFVIKQVYYRITGTVNTQSPYYVTPGYVKRIQLVMDPYFRIAAPPLMISDMSASTSSSEASFDFSVGIAISDTSKFNVKIVDYSGADTGAITKLEVYLIGYLVSSNASNVPANLLLLNNG